MQREICKELRPFSYMIDHEGARRYPLFLYGIQCGPGWVPYIIDLIKIIGHLDIHNKVRIFQIKQKLGGFRFYYNGHELTEKDGKSAIENQVSLYTHKLENMCEICGEPGLCENIEGYLLTLCDTCLDKRLEEI